VQSTGRALLQLLGISVLVAGGLAVAILALLAMLLIGPFVFWLAWNVLDLAGAMGLPELGFWGIVLATLVLVLAWFGKVLLIGIVFLVDPDWFQGAAEVSWPEPTFRNFVALSLLALLASRPHAHAHQRTGRRDR
jgi:hypothetical protein